MFSIHSTQPFLMTSSVFQATKQFVNRVKCLKASTAAYFILILGIALRILAFSTFLGTVFSLYESYKFYRVLYPSLTQQTKLLKDKFSFIDLLLKTLEKDKKKIFTIKTSINQNYDVIFEISKKMDGDLETSNIDILRKKMEIMKKSESTISKIFHSVRDLIKNKNLIERSLNDKKIEFNKIKNSDHTKNIEQNFKTIVAIGLFFLKKAAEYKKIKKEMFSLLNTQLSLITELSDLAKIAGNQ